MRAPVAAAALLLAVGACAPPDAGRPDREAEAFVRIARAEDARPAGGAALQTLLDGTRDGSPDVRRWAVRGLGRLEDPRHHDAIVALLDDPHPRVRAQAADALAQAHHRGDGSAALAPLRARAAVETSPGAVAALGRALGRLRIPLADAREVGRLLSRMSRAEAPGAAVRMPGLVQGMESLARRGGGAGAGAAVGPVLRARLEELARGGWPVAAGTMAPPPTEEAAVRARTVAFLALGASTSPAEEDAPGPGRATVALGLEDPAPSVRRAAAALLRGRADWTELDARALADTEARVRIEGVRAVAVRDRTAERCRTLREVASGDADTGVRLVALDALAVPCPAPERAAQVNLLASTALTLDARAPEDWHAPAHALASLAAVDPAAARELLPGLVTHPNSFARSWAARIAGRLGEVQTLRALLQDPSDNVLTAALPGLVQAQGRAADEVLLATVVAHEDPQLLMTAAGLLEDTDRPGPALGAALQALARLSSEPVQTERDARLALLDLVATVGDSTHVPELEPYIRDHDPRVAERAEEILLAWTGQRWIASPRPGPRLPLPTPAELRAMEEQEVVVEMERGGSFVVRLLPFTAPTNAFRLWTFARDGVLDGLTLHRVVPNFVVQGGSPGGNEYAGHGTYTRDEVGLTSQWRGTVGLSTRGRDTGDGQIYVNLVDNVRLNHDYTILGRVVEGMEVVEAIRAGDVIRGVHLR